MYVYWLDWFFGLLTPDQWESLRNWLATTGGLVALSIALATYVRNARNRREEQARLIYARFASAKALDPGARHWFTATTHMITYGAAEKGFSSLHSAKLGNGIDVHQRFRVLTIEIGNLSKEIMGPVRLQVNYWRNDEDVVNVTYHSVVAPDERLMMELAVPDPGPKPVRDVRTTIEFADSGGRWWRRDGSKPVRSIRSKKPAQEAKDWFDQSAGRFKKPVVISRD